MVRGWYTSASGMTVQKHRIDAISNNIANVNTTGYKRDISIQKAFPELLLRRIQDDGQLRFPTRNMSLGSIDVAPVVGKLGTGVEQNEVYTVFTQGSLRQTNNPFDIALEKEGFFVVETPNGERYTRNGSFILNKEGLLLTKDGFPVLGDNGRITVKLNNFTVDSLGRIFVNQNLQNNQFRLVSQRENDWENTIEIDRLRIINVPRPRYLRKQGSSLWKTSKDSGNPFSLEESERPSIQQGFLETANVNPVIEMIQMIEVNRAYEANQRVIQAQDEATGRLLGRVLSSS